MPKFMYAVAIICIALVSFFFLVTFNENYKIEQYKTLLDDGLAFTFKVNMSDSSAYRIYTFTIIGEESCLHSNDTPRIAETWELDSKDDFHIFTNVIELDNQYYGICVVAKDYDIQRESARSITIIPCGESSVEGCSTGMLPFMLSPARERCSAYSFSPLL